MVIWDAVNSWTHRDKWPDTVPSHKDSSTWECFFIIIIVAYVKKNAFQVVKHDHWICFMTENVHDEAAQSQEVSTVRENIVI